MIDESWCVCVGRLDIGRTWRVDNDHTFWDGGRKDTVFIYYDLVHGLDHDHGLSHGPVLGVGVVVAVGRMCGWTCGAPKDVHPLRRPW